MSSVLKVDNIEKYYGSKANLTKAIDRRKVDDHRSIEQISISNVRRTEAESGKCPSDDYKSISDLSG